MHRDSLQGGDTGFVAAVDPKGARFFAGDARHPDIGGIIRIAEADESRVPMALFGPDPCGFGGLAVEGDGAVRKEFQFSAIGHEPDAGHAFGAFDLARSEM